ncbi:MAG: diguanylate cyclase, partial [Burkholderiaceae bacterium]
MIDVKMLPTTLQSAHIGNGHCEAAPEGVLSLADLTAERLGALLRQAQVHETLSRLALHLIAAQTWPTVAEVLAQALHAVPGWQGFRLDAMQRQGRAASVILATGDVPGLLDEGTQADTLHALWQGSACNASNGSQCILQVPMPLRDGQTLAVLTLSRSQGSAYREADVALVTQVAEHGTAALNRAAAQQQLEQAGRRLTTFSALAHRLSFVTTPFEAGEVIADAADRLIGWDACFLDLYDAASHTICEMINIDIVGGVKQAVSGHQTCGPPGGLECRLLRQGAFLLEQDVTAATQLGTFGDESRPSAAMLFVPARRGDEVVAFFSIQSYTPHAYSAADLELLQALADHCGGALARIGLEESMRLSEERYALAAKGANDGLWDCDLRTRVAYFSPRWKAILGFEEHELEPHVDEWLVRVHDEDRPGLDARVSEHLAGRASLLQHEHRVRHKDGSLRWVLCRGVGVRGKDGKITRMAGSMTDITEAKATEAQLVRAACYDALTGLANRGLFMDRLQHNLQRARRYPEHRFAVVFVDLDRFKLVNDTLGHPVGDALLCGIARRLQAFSRATDTVARMGGDEFTMILEGTSERDDALIVCERILADLRRPFVIAGHEIHASASIGVALHGP